MRKTVCFYLSVVQVSRAKKALHKPAQACLFWGKLTQIQTHKFISTLVVVNYLKAYIKTSWSSLIYSPNHRCLMIYHLPFSSPFGVKLDTPIKSFHFYFVKGKILCPSCHMFEDHVSWIIFSDNTQSFHHFSKMAILSSSLKTC